MNLSNLRILVPNDEVDYLHFEDLMLEKFSGFVRQVTLNDLEELGEVVFWCETHDGAVIDFEGHCSDWHDLQGSGACEPAKRILLTLGFE